LKNGSFVRVEAMRVADDNDYHDEHLVYRALATVISFRMLDG